MKRESRLRRSVDFERARASGRGWSHATLVCYVSSRPEGGPTRVGIVVSKRVGNAVTRNRVKRRIRDAVRGIYPLIKPDHDLVLIARPSAADAHLEELKSTLGNLLQRARVLTSPAPPESPSAATGATS